MMWQIKIPASRMILAGKQSLADLCSADLHGYLHANVDHATEDIKMFLSNCKQLAHGTQTG